MSRLRNCVAKRSQDRSRGAALVEFALVLPLLIAVFVGVIDFGEAWFNSTSVQSGIRSASVVGFDLGNEDPQHDLKVIQSITRELDGRGVGEIESIVIFDADTTAALPSQCTNPASTGASGAAGCNTYGADFIDDVADGTVSFSNAFNTEDCTDGGPGSHWCYSLVGKMAI